MELQVKIKSMWRVWIMVAVCLLAAMPVVSAVVMPAGMLGLVAMPFGFDGFF